MRVINYSCGNSNCHVVHNRTVFCYSAGPMSSAVDKYPPLDDSVVVKKKKKSRSTGPETIPPTKQL